MHKKFLVKRETRTHVLLLCQRQTILIVVAVEVTSLVWQLVEATDYKAYKICHIVGL